MISSASWNSSTLSIIKWSSLSFVLLLAACGSNNSANEKNKSNVQVNNPYTAAGLDTVAAARKPTMDFVDTLHDFGPIHQGERVSYDFSFTNNGKTPLIITSASGSCGCTVPEYPHDAIDPGKTAIMKVTFNSAGKKGHQVKTVTIRANTLRNIHTLFIRADVAEK